jgi:hypothetical protein
MTPFQGHLAPSRAGLLKVRLERTPWPVLVTLVALLPGFFVYNATVAAGLWPPVLRGYSVAAAVLVLPLLIPAYLSRTRAISPFDVVYFGFIGYMLLIVLAGQAIGADATIVGSYLSVIPQWTALYLVARLLDAEDKRARAVIVGSFVVMSMLVAFNVSQSTLFLAAIATVVGERETLATYQDFAVRFLIVTALCAAITTSRTMRIVIFTTAVASLFVTGARSEFLALFVVIVVMEWCRARRRTLVLLVASAAIVGSVITVELVVLQFPDNRVVDLVEKRAEGSVSERQVMLSAAVTTISDNPIAGRFASYVPGEYAHNLFSVWVDFGILGLAWLLMLLAWPGLGLALRRRRFARDPGFLSAAGLFAAAFVLLLVAKAFFYTLVPFALGLYAGWQARSDSTTRLVGVLLTPAATLPKSMAP